jgi:hypothetical protein
MNYQKIYDSIINRGKNRILDKGVDIERHHIIPKCLGGDNRLSNLVELTPEEHYVCHQLLVKLNPKNQKIIYAAVMMTRTSKFNPRKGNKMYGWLRRQHKIAFSGENNPNFGLKRSQETKDKISAANTGRVVTEETKELIREKRKLQTNNKGSKEKGFKHSQESKDKIAAANEGHGRSEERKLNMSIAAKNRLSFSCICCKKEFKHARHFSACIGA